MELIISEQNGWKKPVTIVKAITRIGSAPANDVQLISPEIAPIHLQLIYLKEASSTCKILNLGNPVMVRTSDQRSSLSSLETIQIQNGGEVELGPYRIQFILPLSATTLQETPSIQASLKFPVPTLRPQQVTTGWLNIKNTGGRSSCQVDIDLSGLPVDCMQVDPAPLLYAGGQMDVRIQLFHRRLYPPAGFQNLTVNVSACDSYPGEQVVINQGIYVAPVLEHELEILDDLSIKDPLQRTVAPPVSVLRSVRQDPPQNVQTTPQTLLEELPAETPSSDSEGPDDIRLEKSPGMENEPPIETRETIAEEIPVPVSQSELEPPRPKVVRNQSDDFWEKE